MLQKKICMVGVFGTGKTCLVQRYVHSIFSVKYLSTVGVKIDRKQVTVGSEPITLMLWDLEGRDQHHDLSPSYLRGAHGLIYVVDGTRRETFDQLQDLRGVVDRAAGSVPAVVALNKSDESDTNGVGLVDSAVALSSVSPDEADNERFPMQLAATFREAIDKGRRLRSGQRSSSGGAE